MVAEEEGHTATRGTGLSYCGHTALSKLFGHPSLTFSVKYKTISRGAWGVQSVQRPTSAQVSRSVSSGPASGSVPTARSLEPALDSVSPSLYPTPVRALSLSQKEINIKKNQNK